MTKRAPIKTIKGDTAGQLPFRRSLLLLVAFIEGGSVMAIDRSGCSVRCPQHTRPDAARGIR
jgi:hypothetical protein